MNDIIPAILGDTTPLSIVDVKLPTNPVYVLDLAFLIPLYIVTAIWLLRRHPWSGLLAGGLAVFNSLLSVSIVSSTLVQYSVDQSISLAVVPLFGIIALASFVLTVMYLSKLDGASW